MSKLLRGLVAGYGAKKLGGGCLSTILVFIVLWWVLGSCETFAGTTGQPFAVAEDSDAVAETPDAVAEASDAVAECPDAVAEASDPVSEASDPNASDAVVPPAGDTRVKVVPGRHTRHWYGDPWRAVAGSGTGLERANSLPSTRTISLPSSKEFRPVLLAQLEPDAPR